MDDEWIVIVMTRKILAISGGVDSMVMLDMLQENFNDIGYSPGDIICMEDANCDRVKKVAFAYGYSSGDIFIDKHYSSYDIIIAHFDHGTRLSSADDADFVERVAIRRDLLFIEGYAKLGGNVSEDAARNARYRFLREVAYENNAEIYTAHHLDDLVESIAINLLRGTGWRGLAVLDTPGIRRPFLEPELLPKKMQNLAPLDKKAIYEYAAEHEIIFRQDPTNSEDHYLRNRLRKKLSDFKNKKEIYELWRKQKRLKAEIDELVQELLPKNGEPWQRSWFGDLDENVALELLRAGLLRAGISATRPQILNFYHAILEYPPGKYFNLPNDKLVKLNKAEFYLDF